VAEVFIYPSLFAQHNIKYTSATSDISWTARSQSDTSAQDLS